MPNRGRVYSILLSVTVCLLLVYEYQPKNDNAYTNSHAVERSKRTFFLPPDTSNSHSFISQDTDFECSQESVNTIHVPSSPKDCFMHNCFDYSKCGGDFKVYVYPESAEPSDYYKKILEAVKRSKYVTDQPEKACLFITSIDTLDRDKLSANFAPNLQQQLTLLPHWNGGRNHLIFNLYSGTWPDYSEHLDVDVGFAMFAKASISTEFFRAGFDISLPLFHKTLPQRDGQAGELKHLNIPSVSKYTLAFKGKRYLTGIGSDSRNMLYHMHNDKDVILLTTCKHGKGWEKYADERCNIDNELYDRYDYGQLLANSTFCLVPRGRRLGSFRFLEVLQYGCVPVLLSNGWELPFSEVINWSQAVIWADESLVFQIPHIVKSVPLTRVLALQQQSQFLWDSYFSSIDKIVFTVLEIVRSRVQPENALSTSVWNTHPGAHALQPSFSKDLTQYPFFTRPNGQTQFTAIIIITQRNKHVRRILDTVAAAQSLSMMYVLAETMDEGLVDYLTHVASYIENVPVNVQHITNVIDAYKMYKSFPTDAIFITHQHDSLLTEEIDFAFSAWKELPERIVGYQSRSHLWHEGHQTYYYTSKLLNQYSVVLTDVAIFHKYYAQRFVQLTSSWREQDSVEHCSALLLNFIVSDITKLPPVKLAQRSRFDSTGDQTPNRSAWQELQLNNQCMNQFWKKFGRMPLHNSVVRLDPTLYKDRVSKLRKRYPRLESSQ